MRKSEAQKLLLARQRAIMTSAVIAAGLAGAPAAPPARAQEAAPPRITLQVTNGDLREVLATLFKTAKVEYAIADDVRGRISVSLKDIPFEQALRLVLRTAPVPLTYSGGGVYRVRRRVETATTAAPATISAPTPPRRFNLEMGNAPIVNALQSLFDRVAEATTPPPAGPLFRVAEAARASVVTVRVADKPLEDVLNLLAESATPKLTWKKAGDGVYEFAPRPAAEAPVVLPAPVIPAPLVTLDARDAPVRSVLVDLFRQAKITNYSIAPDVAGYITIKVQEKPFEDTLAFIARVARPALSYGKTPEGFYEVRARRLSQSGESAAPNGAAAAPAPTALANWEVVRPVYAPADDIVAVLEAARPESVTRVFAYLPLNLVLVKCGPPGEGFQTGVFGYGRGGTAGGRPSSGGGGATPGGNTNNSANKNGGNNGGE